ncbi:hypothetical protein L596_005178 [Steinernema carpocapsae]|uniref:Uncharacterized protein n=1 Tax=Steinernema carpocapsae TaxID=34508 RepID=A0A4U8UY65_STECR|nr:hypothetical protein L596_005178 [Steinernema carpocapsae]
MFTLCHMLVYALQDHFDKFHSQATFLRNRLRFCCVIVLGVSIFPVLHSFRTFIDVAACHPMIPKMEAAFEYTSLGAILIFYYSTVFDLEDVEVVVSAYHREVYERDFPPEYWPVQFADGPESMDKEVHVIPCNK